MCDIRINFYILFVNESRHNNNNNNKQLSNKQIERWTMFFFLFYTIQIPTAANHSLQLSLTNLIAPHVYVHLTIIYIANNLTIVLYVDACSRLLIGIFFSGTPLSMMMKRKKPIFYSLLNSTSDSYNATKCFLFLFGQLILTIHGSG